MVLLIAGVIVLLGMHGANAKDVKTRDEFIKYDDQGTVILHGKYTRDSNGRVIRYDVYDGKEALKYYEIAYYKEDGSIIRGDTFAPDGSLIRVAVFFEKTIKVFDKNGNHLPEYDQSYSPFEDNRKSNKASQPISGKPGSG